MAAKGGRIDFMFLGPPYPTAGSDAAFRMAFLLKEISDNNSFCVREHTATISVNGLFNRLQEGVRRYDSNSQVVTSHTSQTCQHARRAFVTYSILQLILMIKSYFSQFIFYSTLYKYW